MRTTGMPGQPLTPTSRCMSSNPSPASGWGRSAQARGENGWQVAVRLLRLSPGGPRRQAPSVTVPARAAGLSSSRRASCRRAKTTVKSAPCGRVLRMALRATLECDLPRQRTGIYQEDVPNSTRLLRAMTRGVVPLPFCGTCRLARCRCLPCLLAGQTALTPSANPPGKHGLHHSHLPLPHGRAMANQAGRFVLRLLIPGLRCPTASARRHSPGFERTPAQSQADSIVMEAIAGRRCQATVDGRGPPQCGMAMGTGLAGFWPDSSVQRRQMLRNAEQRSGRSRTQWLVSKSACRSLRICEYRSDGPGWTAARIGAGGLGDSLRIWPLVCVPFI